MRELKFELELFIVSLFFLIVNLTEFSDGESSTCLTVYKEGGAPAVFLSPKCPRWKLSNYDSTPLRTSTCQSSVHQGRRRSLEDRVFCNLDVRIPFLGETGLMEVDVGIMAVFDGHNGAEASEMASKLLLEYFVLHAYFLLDATYYALLKTSMGWLPNKGEHDVVFRVLNTDKLRWHDSLERYKLSLPVIFDGSFRLEVLKISLLRAIRDIDATFSKEASRYNLDSGSTAAVIVIAEGQFLVANVGDSKALLCSERFQSAAEAKATLVRLYREKRRSGAILPVKNRYNLDLSTSNGLAHFYVKELTRDHHPDRDDERSRVENAGGYVLEWGGVPRVNGELAVSRAIGDVSFKSYGVISTPELTDWQPLTANDSYLVAASDGVFEKLTSQDICDILWEVHGRHTTQSQVSSVCSSYSSLADCLVNFAFDKGSMDNMAAVLVPLRSTGYFQDLMTKRSDGKGTFDCSTVGLQKSIYRQSANGITSGFGQLEHVHPVMTKFDRLLVESKHKKGGMFYLSDRLSEDEEFTLAQKDDDETNVYDKDLPQTLPDSLAYGCGGLVNLYNDKKMCFPFAMATDGTRDQCINTEGFASFLGFLESIPFHSTGSSHESFESAMPEHRYKLKKRFGRGSYGEVWLAFNWNLSQGTHSSTWNVQNQNLSHHSIYSESYDTKSNTISSANYDHASNLFILKRIMVERGTDVYLSGLREKYFGEVFLNASLSLGRKDFDELLMNNSDVLETENTLFLDNPFIETSSLAVHEEGLNHIARYVEALESQSNEIWLVFHHEGTSLSKLMYTIDEVENSDDEKEERVNLIQVLRPSKWWHWLKTTDAGQNEMREIIRQLLMALKSCHDRNITHRDIKPECVFLSPLEENMVICFEEQDTGRCLKGRPSGDKNATAKMRIIDFGSAIDEFTMKHLYGSTGPSRAEQTSEYSPPEASLNGTWYQGQTSTTLKYDMWSVGVVILELILGSPDVFQIDAVTRALLDPHLEGWNDGLKELAYKLRSLMELCILVPGSSLKHHGTGGTKYRGGVSPASWKCSEEFFANQIKSRDPHKLGFPNVWLMRLVRQLLLWDPDDRLSVDDALRHPYFQDPHR